MQQRTGKVRGTSEAAPIALDDVLSRLRLSRLLGLFLLCGLTLAVDGFDMYMVGAVAPALAVHFGAPPSAVTSIFVAQGLGLAAGYAFVTPAADRLGRRPLILGCVAAFAVLTLVATQAASLMQLAGLRFVAFVFFGSTMANLNALIGEMVPEARRQRVIVAVNGVHAFGAALGSLIAPPLLRAFGWNAPFWAGGVAPLLLLPALVFLLPESPRFLIVTSAPAERIARSLRRLGDRDADQHGGRVTAEPPSPPVPLRELFRDGRLRATVLFMAMGALTLLTVNLVSSWLPTFLHLMSGYEMVEAARFLAWSSLGAILWPVTFMILLVRAVGLKRAVIASYVLGAGALSLFALSPLPPIAAIAVGLGFGAFVIGSVGGMNALVIATYPTRIRAGAIGQTAAIGRVVSVAGPALGGLMVAERFPAPAIACVLAVPLLLAAVCTALLPVSSRLN